MRKKKSKKNLIDTTCKHGQFLAFYSTAVYGGEVTSTCQCCYVRFTKIKEIKLKKHLRGIAIYCERCSQ